MEADERLQAEISLLEAMYPDHVVYDAKAREVKYTAEAASFQLRLPSGYLIDQLPEVISAKFGREDGRAAVKQKLQQCEIGEEVLDSIISSFTELAELHQSDQNVHISSKPKDVAIHDDAQKATVIVWLHHLLNTNKRKQALSPPSSGVSGITKPGYPGVLVYSGPSSAVYEHVNELRQLNWQAFSVRLEDDQEWIFKHGLGVKEFETMKEVVADIDEARKEEFMEAMRMK